MFYIVYYFISLEFGEAIVYGVNVPKLTQVYGNQTYRKNINSYCSIKLEKGIFFKMKLKYEFLKMILINFQCCCIVNISLLCNTVYLVVQTVDVFLGMLNIRGLFPLLKNTNSFEFNRIG